MTLFCVSCACRHPQVPSLVCCTCSAQLPPSRRSMTALRLLGARVAAGGHLDYFINNAAAPQSCSPVRHRCRPLPPPPPPTATACRFSRASSAAALAAALPQHDRRSQPPRQAASPGAGGRIGRCPAADGGAGAGCSRRSRGRRRRRSQQCPTSQEGEAGRDAYAGAAARHPSRPSRMGQRSAACGQTKGARHGEPLFGGFVHQKASQSASKPTGLVSPPAGAHQSCVIRSEPGSAPSPVNLPRTGPASTCAASCAARWRRCCARRTERSRWGTQVRTDRGSQRARRVGCERVAGCLLPAHR